MRAPSDATRACDRRGGGEAVGPYVVPMMVEVDVDDDKVTRVVTVPVEVREAPEAWATF